jgi:hypothetical protein
MNPPLSVSFGMLAIVFAAVGSAHAAGYATDSASPASAESRDRLAWLGPLPEHLTQQAADDAFQQSASKALGEIATDVTSADASAFVCRSPAETGPVRDLDAVDRYIAGLPASANGGKLQDDLFKAAAKGNWLATAWVFTYLTEERPMTAEAFYRSAQLLDLMRERRTGQLYVFIGRHYYASPEFAQLAHADGPSQFDIAAANHSSYPAQYRVGQDLQGSSVSRLKQIGNDMLNCARKALPAYARLFKAASMEKAADD